ncbi:MAG TPA: hypothetical protein VFV87_19080 [Pirellulaceae bacterium]|nr:hypothetical protein [Pirellulaceae bacterium]
MDTNPYKDPAPTSDPKRFGMKSRIFWFVLGFGTAWVIWSVTNYRALSPRDYTQNWPEELREDAPEWMKSARGRRVGLFTILAADDPQRASAQVYPSQPDRNPSVAYEDTDADGRADSLLVTDSNRRTFSFAIADGKFTSYEYSPDVMASDSITFVDHDLHGGFDLRFGPGGKHAMSVDSRWYELIPTGGHKGYVNINGKQVPAEHVNGAWRIVEQSQ